MILFYQNGGERSSFVSSVLHLCYLLLFLFFLSEVLPSSARWQDCKSHGYLLPIKIETFSWRKTLFFANVISLKSKHHQQLFISFSVQLYRRFSRFLFFLCFKLNFFYWRLFTVLIHFLRINKTKVNKVYREEKMAACVFQGRVPRGCSL